MKVIAFIMTITIVIFAGQVRAQDVARGQALYSSCVACHGDKGLGSEEKAAPKLAGQFDWYIVTALSNYKSGERKHPSMKSFSKQEMDDLAAYISQLK